MFLKSIEIRGFKSFADKTDLSFKKGVTAVVGPNGSGKSNISDAIRWVLGEQSIKTLRGGKMEDVIFAGTQFRKPVGLAQVSLTLDNSRGELPVDYSDVTISRRLYRNGDSDYLINNNSCRLKDIQELFMDTGIGKEGYSIIGQGKIDAILSGKPEERRTLLEEAAGIVKFKSRKEESEKKLGVAEQNLIRINDILSTYEERMGPLEEESKKAKEFLELSNNQRAMEISLIVRSITDLNERLGEFEKKIEENTKAKDDLIKERENLKVSLINLNMNLETEEKKFGEEQSSFYKHKEHIQNLNGDIVVLEEKIKNLEVYLQKDASEMDSIKEKIVTLENAKNEEETKLLELQSQGNFYEGQVEKAEITIKDYNENSFTVEKKVKEAREADIEILRKISNMKNEEVIMEKEIENLNNRIQGISELKSNYNNNLAINITTTKLLRDEVEKLNSNMSEIEDKIKENKKEMKVLLSSINNLENQHKDQGIKLSKVEANYNILLDLEKRYEGYNKAVKNLMEHIEKNMVNIAPHKVNVLGEIINVEKRFETAIDIALGSAVSNIITEDEIMAKNLIEYLKRKNLGRATFLPLSIIKGKKIILNDGIKKLKGFIGIASDIIEYDLLYDNIVNSILGKTIICDNMESALNVARISNHSYRIVTLDGEVINPGGAMTGGSIYHKNSNVIGRKREIEELAIEKHELFMKQNKLEIEVNNKKATFKDLDEETLNMRDEIHYKTIEIAKVQERINSVENDNKKLNDGILTSEREIALINNRINEFKIKLESKNKDISQLIIKEEKNKEYIKNLEEELARVNSELEIIKEDLTTLKVQKAELDQKLSEKINNLRRVDTEIEDSKRKIYTLEKETKTNKANKEIFIEGIEEKSKEILLYKDKVISMEQKFEEYENHRSYLKRSINQTNIKVEDINSVIIKYEEVINKLNFSKAKYETEIESYLKKLNEDMNLTYAEAEELGDKNINVEYTKKEISKIKSNITALGTVNLGAIEEYEDVKTKYTFMNLQREDLEKAKKELIGVINEMTSKMRTMFNENFQILRANFNATFQELFKGGRADLILSEGDELSANIEINVEPPGKKLQNINLMSGGEKVLSAIALLFAILKMKPTPFCILDEIEAALDDANVYRYAEFLKIFSENIQFIVITHRKGTMEASDVLYGVTMEEKGVSKIVSVDLSA